MKRMILDTSSKLLYVCFMDDNKIIYEVITEGENNHSDHLITKIEEGLSKLNLSVSDFDEFVCGYGPGRYTGLRVALTVIKTFAWTLNKKMYVCSSLDLLASHYFNKDGIYFELLRAKKDYSYAKIFKIENGKYALLKEEEFVLDEEFIDKYSKKYQDYVLINNDNIKIDILNMKEDMYKVVSDIHNLSPNYVREDVI